MKSDKMLKVMLLFSGITQIFIILILVRFLRHNYFDLLIVTIAFTLFYFCTVSALAMRIAEVRKELKKTRDMSRSFEKEIEELRIKQHDLKNQIAVIKTYSENSGDRQTDAVQRFVAEMESQLAEASVLLKFNDSLLSALISNEMKKASKKSIALNVRSNLKQIPEELDHYDSIELIGNLLDNAIDASGERGEITAEINQADDDLTISVINDGNLRCSNIDLLFEPGFSTKGEKRGYGLAIVKRIANRHGGKIEVTDCGGKVEFKVRLPLSCNSIKH